MECLESVARMIAQNEHDGLKVLSKSLQNQLGYLQPIPEAQILSLKLDVASSSLIPPDKFDLGPNDIVFAAS